MVPLRSQFKLGFSLNEVSQLGISTLKSPLHGIAKAKDWWFQFHSLTFHIPLSFTTESKTPIVLPVSCDQSDLVGSKLIYEKDSQWPDIRNIAKMLGAKRCCWRVSLNRVRAKTEDRESPSQRYAVEERVGCPFKAICFFAPLADLGRVGDSSLIEEGR